MDNKSVLVQVMAWRQTGDKPLPEPMLTQFPLGGDELKRRHLMSASYIFNNVLG